MSPVTRPSSATACTLVWAVGVLISALLVFATADVATKTGADVLGKTVSSLATRTDRMDAVLDTMLRSTTTVQAAAPGSTAPTTTTTRQRAANMDETRAEITRILASSIANGSNTNENRTYLAQLVAQRTGVTQQDAERRVDDAVNAVRAAADKARHAAILTGFVTAAALIISLAAGWWAATRGGHHRDTAVPARFTFGDRRRAPVA